MERYQRLMIAHGFLIALVGLVAGFFTIILFNWGRRSLARLYFPL